MVEAPQSFVVREECAKAASQNGFRRVLGQEAGWAVFGSTTAEGTIHLAAAGSQGPWFIALDHADVVAELGLQTADMTGPARFRFASITWVRSTKLCAACMSSLSAFRTHHCENSRHKLLVCHVRPTQSGKLCRGSARTSFAPG